MSRIGKQPVLVPDNVHVTVTGNMIRAQGAKGNMEQVLWPGFEVSVQQNLIFVKPKNDTALLEKGWNARFGLYRMLIANMIKGVHQGYQQRLEIVGVGYKIFKKGELLELNVGYSAPVKVTPLTLVKLDIEGSNIIVVSGPDKQAVGQMAADIRKIRPPEPYKGKGIRYQNEHVKRKAGKAGVTGAGT